MINKKIGLNIENYPMMCLLYELNGNMAKVSVVKNLDNVKGRVEVKKVSEVDVKEENGRKYIKYDGVIFYLDHFEIMPSTHFQFQEKNNRLIYLHLFKAFKNPSDTVRFVIGVTKHKKDVPNVNHYEYSPFKVYRVNYDKHRGYIKDRIDNMEVKFYLNEFREAKDWGVSV